MNTATGLAWLLCFLYLTSLSETHSITLEEMTLESFVCQDRSETVWMVLFSAAHCYHCKALKPTWTELSQDKRLDKMQIKFAEVDAEANRGISRRFDVYRYPTVKLFTKGLMYDYGDGGRSFEEIKEFAVAGYKTQPALPIPPMPKTRPAPAVDGGRNASLYDTTNTASLTQLVCVAILIVGVAIITYATKGGVLASRKIGEVAAKSRRDKRK